jgi:hypothetical protein
MKLMDAKIDSVPPTLPSGSRALASHATIAVPEERPTVAELPTRPLHELDVPMAMRVLRFEITLEESGSLDDPRLGLARALRSLLLRAAAYGAAETDGAVSLEASVTHVVRRTYAWAFRALDAAIAAQPVRPLPRAAEQLGAEVIEACEARLSFDPLLARLRDTLLDLGVVAARLSAARPDLDGASRYAP